jgi:hypothetical protein
VADIVARAHRDGSLRADVTPLDITWLIEQFSRRAPDPVDPDEERNARSRLVAIALDGLRARSADVLPGRPPSRARYVNRWSRASERDRPGDLAAERGQVHGRVTHDEVAAARSEWPQG